MISSRAFADLAETAEALAPCAALVLGSGMGKVAGRLRPLLSVPFIDVPGLEAASVAGHGGQLTLGDWAGRRVLVFEGRIHFYECQSWRAVLAPVQAAHFLGARTLLMTNAAGGIHEALAPGSLMAIRDHILWNVPYCWKQLQRQPSPYSPRLRQLLALAAQESGVRLHEGVYAAVTGPCYETPAEVRALRAWGADAVGMSTAREVETAHSLGMECAAISLITNRAAGLTSGPLHHDEVLTSAHAETDRVGKLIESFLSLLGLNPHP